MSPAAGNSGSPGNPPNGSLYASADAARVGEGLYHQLVQAACLLAQDPFPRVNQLGKAALLLAGVELTPALHSPPPPGHVPRGPNLDKGGLSREYCLHEVLAKADTEARCRQALSCPYIGSFALCCHSDICRALHAALSTYAVNVILALLSLLSIALVCVLCQPTTEVLRVCQ